MKVRFGLLLLVDKLLAAEAQNGIWAANVYQNIITLKNKNFMQYGVHQEYYGDSTLDTMSPVGQCSPDSE